MSPNAFQKELSAAESSVRGERRVSVGVVRGGRRAGAAHCWTNAARHSLRSVTNARRETSALGPPDARHRAARRPPSGRQTPAIGPQQLIISKTWFSQNPVQFVLRKTIYLIAMVDMLLPPEVHAVFVTHHSTYFITVLITFKLTSMLRHVDKFF